MPCSFVSLVLTPPLNSDSSIQLSAFLAFPLLYNGQTEILDFTTLQNFCSPSQKMSTTSTQLCNLEATGSFFRPLFIDLYINLARLLNSVSKRILSSVHYFPLH